MPNQLIGVSPPLVGKAQDSKVDLKKDFKEASPREYKNDFEKTLKEKLALKEKVKDKEKDKVDTPESDVKEAHLKKKDDDQESKVEVKEKKSSGGTKKKMTEKVDDQMISKFMASTENEVEIPESKTDLAEIKESQPQQVQIRAASAGPADLLDVPSVSPKAVGEIPAQAASPLMQMDQLPKELTEKIQALQASPQIAQIESAVDADEVILDDSKSQFATPVTASLGLATVFQPDELIQKIKALDVAPLKDATLATSQVAPAFVAEVPDAISVPELGTKLTAQAETLLPQVEISGAVAPDVSQMVAPQVLAAPVATPPVFNLEQELGSMVGFKPEESSAPPKVFEGEKAVNTQKAQDFQKSVYDQLQKMDSRQPTAALQSNTSGNEKGQSQSDDPSQKSLKTELAPQAELQHTGQSHGDFKSQLAAAPIASGSEQQRAQLLEANHEKNIQEVLNQAQYLIKKGGGEMKVSMSPDGLAEVQMKVMLQDGRVNIEMSTQDKTVRKLIEESLTDLRSSLAAQHLTIDHVKINSVTATNTDNSAQFQSNWNGSGAEHRQREFWTQFQDNMNQNKAFRSNYASNAGTSSSSVAAVDAASAAAIPLRTNGGSKGSQVNRVA